MTFCRKRLIEESILSNISRLQSPTLLRILRSCFSRILAIDNGPNFVENICFTEQPLLSKNTTACLWNFCFLELCMHFISTFIYKEDATREQWLCGITALRERERESCPRKVPEIPSKLSTLLKFLG